MAIKIGALQTVICNGDYTDIPLPITFFLSLYWVLSRQKSIKPESTKEKKDVNANNEFVTFNIPSGDSSKMD